MSHKIDVQRLALQAGLFVEPGMMSALTEFTRRVLEECARLVTQYPQDSDITDDIADAIRRML